MSAEKERTLTSADGLELHCKCGHPLEQHSEPWCSMCGCDNPDAIAESGVRVRTEQFPADGSRVPATTTSDGSGLRKPLVYIAGPYTNPDPVINVREACFAADRLVDAGAAVIVPHLSMLWHTVSPKDLADWYAIDIDVLAHCDLIVRLPGQSTGADAEVVEAERLGIPVHDLASGVVAVMTR